MSDMRRSMILEDLILACQTGRMTRQEKDKALWIMRVTGWTLENVVGIPTDLREKMVAVCPLLAGNSGVRAADARTEPATVIDAVKELKPIETFGLSPAPDDERHTYHDSGETEQ